MKKLIALVVDWYGPYYSRKAASSAAKEFQSGLYMASGRCAYQKYNRLQYVGIAKSLQERLSNSHPKLQMITQHSTYWLGEVGSVGIPGPKAKVTDIRIDLAEWAHSYFLKLPLNERKKTPPDHPVTVINRWWKCDLETPRIHRPSPQWPDLIDYRGADHGGQICWLGGRRVRIKIQ